MMLPPVSLRIFVAADDPVGLRIVERSNWLGRALVFPREDGEGGRLYRGLKFDHRCLFTDEIDIPDDHITSH